MPVATSIGFDIVAHDRASRTLDSVGNAADKSGAKWRGMAKAVKYAALGLGAAVVIGAKALVGMTKNAAEDEAAQRRLALAMKNSVGASKAQVAGVEDWISAQGVATGITDDEMRPALQRLIESTGSVSKAQRQMKIAMDVSAGTGKSLSTVTAAMMKANNGTTASLSKLGLKTKDAQGNTLSLREAMKSMASTFKGQVAARADSLQGKIDRLRLIFDETKETIGAKVIPVLSNLGGWFLNKGIPAISGFTDSMRDTLGPAASKAVDLIRAGFAKLEGLNLGSIGPKLAQQAKGWAGPIIEGFKVGMRTGDWSGLGSTIGTGVASAMNGVGSTMGKLTDSVSKWFAKVDWMSVGLSMGKQAPTLVTGLAMGLINFDIVGLLQGVGAHWQEALVAVISVALLPAKIVGVIAKLLARIPFVGRLLAWGLTAFKGFSDGLVKAAGRALSSLGRSFMAGFRRVFPGVGKNFAENLKLLPLRVAIVAIELQGRAVRMMRGLASAIGRGIGGVVAKIGELIAKLLRPFAGAGSWLVKRGADAVRGLGRGVSGAIGAVVAVARSIGGKILSGVGNLGSLLYGAGKAVISGLIDGVRAMIGPLTSALGAITKLIPKKKGPIDKDRKLLRPAGEALIEGLIAGITKKWVSAERILKALTGRIKATGDKVKSLMGARSEFAKGFQGFSGSMFGLDLSGTSGEADAMLNYQQAELEKARQLRVDVARLTKAKLSGGLLKQLQASGESGIAQIHALAQGTDQQIRLAGSLHKQTQAELGRTGANAAQALYGDDIKAAQRENRLARKIGEAVRRELNGRDADEVVFRLRGDELVAVLKKTKRVRGNKPLGIS